MGLRGFRLAIVYSYNDTVVNCGRKMSSFGLVSSQTLQLLASMLADEEFVNMFLTESSKRLGNRHKIFIGGLKEVGIKCLESNAGLFSWMDLRPMLNKPTFEGEMALWQVIIDELKLNVSPGWFRVCFANMDDETMEIAIRRIRTFCGRKKGNRYTGKELTI